MMVFWPKAGLVSSCGSAKEPDQKVLESQESVVIPSLRANQPSGAFEAAVKQLVNRAASGETRSMSLLLALIQASEAKPLQTEAGAPSADDALVMREIARRMKGEAP